MNTLDVDIVNTCVWHEGLPYPQWNLIDSWIESRGDPGDSRNVWVALGRQWISELGFALGGDREFAESEHFLGLAFPELIAGNRLLQFAEQCRDRLLSSLGEVTRFDVPGKQMVLSFQTSEEYYRYISFYYPEGKHGASVGIQIRDGYPHVALFGNQPWMMESCLAHELTHVSLQHLSMPQWLEEGLAQMFACDMTGESGLLVDEEVAARHKRYWGKHGLNAFWSGESFSRPGKVQELSYQLAEILVRLMDADARPGWLGWGRNRRQRFVRFLQQASDSDCGAAACREHLQCDLADLAARFLGVGSWSSDL